MKAFLLYCLFLFPLSYAITKDSYMEQNSTRRHSSAGQDTLYIETEKAEFGIRKLDCFAVYDNVADGNRFLFYDYESKVIHMTPACFSDFYPICSSADFSKGEVLLINRHSHLKQPNDTVSIDSKVTYVPFNRNNRIIKAKLVPYTQVEKDKIYQTTEDNT